MLVAGGFGDQAAPGLGGSGVQARTGESGLDRRDKASAGAGEGVAEMALPGAVLGAPFEELAKLGNESGGGSEVDAPGVLDLAGVVAGAVARVPMAESFQAIAPRRCMAASLRRTWDVEIPSL